jgi:hypothetical protein
MSNYTVQHSIDLGYLAPDAPLVQFPPIDPSPLKINTCRNDSLEFYDDNEDQNNDNNGDQNNDNNGDQNNDNNGDQNNDEEYGEYGQWLSENSPQVTYTNPGDVPPDSKCQDIASQITADNNDFTEQANNMINEYLQKVSDNNPNCTTNNSKVAVASVYLGGGGAASNDYSSGCQNVAMQAALNLSMNTSLNCTSSNLSSTTSGDSSIKATVDITIIADEIKGSTIKGLLGIDSKQQILNVVDSSVQSAVTEALQTGMQTFQKTAQKSVQDQTGFFATNSKNPSQQMVSNINNIISNSVNIITKKTVASIVAKNVVETDGKLFIQAGKIVDSSITLSNEVANEVILQSIVNDVIGQILKKSNVTDLLTKQESENEYKSKAVKSVFGVLFFILIAGGIIGGIYYYLGKKKKRNISGVRPGYSKFPQQRINQYYENYLPRQQRKAYGTFGKYGEKPPPLETSYNPTNKYGANPYIPNGANGGYPNGGNLYGGNPNGGNPVTAPQYNPYGGNPTGGNPTGGNPTGGYSRIQYR